MVWVSQTQRHPCFKSSSALFLVVEASLYPSIPLFIVCLHPELPSSLLVPVHPSGGIASTKPFLSIPSPRLARWHLGTTLGCKQWSHWLLLPVHVPISPTGLGLPPEQVVWDQFFYFCLKLWAHNLCYMHVCWVNEVMNEYITENYVLMNY